MNDAIPNPFEVLRLDPATPAEVYSTHFVSALNRLKSIGDSGQMPMSQSRRAKVERNSP